jgi:hypothetical protein
MGYAEEDINRQEMVIIRDSQDADSLAPLKVKPLQSWKGYLWDTWELPSDQRWLLFKLDAFILTFASVSDLPHFIRRVMSVLIKRPSSATFSKILILTTSTMPFSAAWKRI